MFMRHNDKKWLSGGPNLYADNALSDTISEVYDVWFLIGAAGLLVCFGVWFLDYKLRIDDPTGAVAVHCINGIWGTIAVGFFATDTAPAYARGYGDGISYGANQISQVALETERFLYN